MLNQSDLVLKKFEELKTYQDTIGVESALNHLEVASRHFERAINERDETLFTDVIYRTNQVFEGMLKEAITLLARVDGSKLSPYKIEEKLQNGGLLSGRVMPYLQKYRTEWRNPSTHDHRIDFSEQESFLAISSVTSFCYVLIDQMLQKIAEESVANSSELTPREFEKDINVSKLANVLRGFLPKFVSEAVEGGPPPSEVLLTGFVTGLLSFLVPKESISIEHLSPGSSKGIVDVLVELEAGAVPIEIKVLKKGPFRTRIDSGIIQVSKFAEELGVTDAILIIFTEDDGWKQKAYSNQFGFKVGGVQVHPVVIPLSNGGK